MAKAHYRCPSCGEELILERDDTNPPTCPIAFIRPKIGLTACGRQLVLETVLLGA